ncbi:MAG: DNA polymerase III subunit gamma/tau [Ktedonobacteraceae bacterium]
MASQSLYRKWRSQTFGDLVGQEPVIRTLKNALTGGKLAHAYLFTGPRGTGKTTTARLLAKTINCSNPVEGEPCNQCQQCREITAGNSFNVIEIDAASNRGIDSIRDLREKVMMPPSTGKYKVYVLDEAHMLTTEAFNALLKTLEEPPPYAIFVLATTDVHKMLPTVLSRCQRFDFKRITTRQIVAHLEYVADQEQIKIERSAAELIARAAAGGMRDALSLLDQAIAYSGTEISLPQVQAMLGVADPRAIYKLVTHVSQLDSAAVLHLIHELSEAGADLRQLNNQVGEYWRALMLAKAGADVTSILDLTEDEAREILQMTRLFELEQLTEFARIFAQNDLVQKNQGTPQLGLELAFLQCIELHRQAQSVPPVQLRPAESRARLQSSVSPELRQSSPPPASQPSSPKAHQGWSDSISDPANFSPVDGSERKSEQVATHAAHLSAADALSQQYVAAAGHGSEPSVTLEQVKEVWERVKKRVRGRNSTGPKTAAYLNDYTIVGVVGDGDTTVVIMQAAHTLHYKYMQEGGYSADVEWALGLEFDQKCRVRLLAPGQPVPTTPAPSSNSSPPEFRQVEKGSSSEMAEEVPSVIVSSPADDQNSPVVKKIIVRENTTSGPTDSSQPSLETIEQKANSDPVVQEVIKTFAAKIVHIRPK